MQARIRVQRSDDVGTDLASLHDWLRAEEALRGKVKRETRTAQPGEMGAVSDVLVAALGNGGAVTALVASLGTWLATRRSRVTLKVTGPDDRSVEVSGRAADVKDLLRTVLPEQLEQGEADR